MLLKSPQWHRHPTMVAVSEAKGTTEISSWPAKRVTRFAHARIVKAGIHRLIEEKMADRPLAVGVAA